MKKKLVDLLRNSRYTYSLIALFVVIILATLASSSFLAGDNLMSVLRQASLLFILSSGLTAVVLTGGIDLSVNNTAALVGCIVAQLLLLNLSIPIVIAAGLLVGVIIGIFNGFLVGFLGFPLL